MKQSIHLPAARAAALAAALAFSASTIMPVAAFAQAAAPAPSAAPAPAPTPAPGAPPAAAAPDAAAPAPGAPPAATTPPDPNAPAPATAAAPPAPTDANAPSAAASDNGNGTETVANPYGLSALWKSGDIVARSTLVILVIMSFGTWYIMITKFVEQASIFRAARAAARDFWKTTSVREGVQRLKPASPFRYIAENGISATEHHDGALTDSIDLHTWVTMSIQRAVDTISSRLQGGLAFLATVGSTAPFLSASGRARDWRLGRWRVPAGLAVALTAGNLVALPVYSLVWRAGRVGGRAVGGLAPHWSFGGLVGTLGLAAGELYGPGPARPLRSPMLSSAILAGLGASATVALAWSLAWLARRPGAWRWIAAGVVAVTLAAPGPVAGMALMVAYFPWPRVYDSPLMVVLAYVLRTLPYAVLLLWPSIRTLPPAYLESAAIEGYGPWGRIRRVALPLTLGPIAASWGVAFALSLGELPAANLVVPPGTTLLSVRVWELLHTGVESHLAGVGLITLAVDRRRARMVATWRLGRA